MAIIDAWDRRGVADVIIDIDRPLFTYTFTYKITSRGNGVVLATGKVTAFDANAAAPKLAERIIEEMRIARGEAKTKKKAVSGEPAITQQIARRAAAVRQSPPSTAHRSIDRQAVRL